MRGDGPGWVSGWTNAQQERRVNELEMTGGLLDDPRPLWARVGDMLVQNLIIAACGLGAFGLAMWLIR